MTFPGLRSPMAMLELPHTRGCLVCGQANPHGLKLHLHVDPATGIVSTEFTPRVEHIGFDGIVHGGILATVLDEAMVWAATWSGKRFCVCGELSVRFRQSAEVGQKVIVTARVEVARSKLITTTSEVLAGDVILATATGKYVPLPADRSNHFFDTLVDEPATMAAATILRASP